MIRHAELDPMAPDEQGRPRWNATPGLLAAHPHLSAFVVSPALMEKTWAGDNPEAPFLTVPLRFDDAAAEAAALAAFDTPEEEGAPHAET